MPKRCIVALIALIALSCLARSAAAAVTHTVVRGENLYRIARQYWPEAYASDPYGCVKRIIDANALKDPGSIFPGEKLSIPVDAPQGEALSEQQPSSPPPAELPSEDDLRRVATADDRDTGSAGPATVAPAAAAPAEATTVRWTVQPHETPAAIAAALGRRYGCSIDWRAMLAENGISDPRKLPEGKTLVVTLPGAQGVETPSAPAEKEALLGVSLDERASGDGAESSSTVEQGEDASEETGEAGPSITTAAGLHGELLDLGLLRPYKSQSDATELLRAVKRLYSSATYKTFRGTVKTKKDGSLRIMKGSTDVTREILDEVARQHRLREEARRTLGDHFDSPVEHPDFSRWLGEASTHLTRVSDPRKRLAIMKTLVKIESSGGQNLVSSAGCIGVGQLAIATADTYDANPWDARQNLRASAQFINDLLKRYGGSLHKAMAYYNGGGDLSNGASYARNFTAQVDRRLA